MVRGGEPLSRIERRQPGGGLLIDESRVPRACRAATDPADGMRACSSRGHSTWVIAHTNPVSSRAAAADVRSHREELQLARLSIQHAATIFDACTSKPT